MKPFIQINFLLLNICLMKSLTAAEWESLRKPMSGEYIIYSGELGDMSSPQEGNKKLAIEISGRSARDIFNSIGPDIRNACGAGTALAFARKTMVRCLAPAAKKANTVATSAST
jgi:hypothetical protein